jgi:hypothetical protein
MWWLWVACTGQPDLPKTPPAPRVDGWTQITKDVPYFTSVSESPALSSQIYNHCGADVAHQRDCIRAALEDLGHQGMQFSEVAGTPHVQTITANDNGGVAVLLDTAIHITNGRIDQFDMQGVPGTESGPQVSFIPPELLKSPPLIAINIVDASAFSMTGPDNRPLVYRRKDAK